MEEPDRPHWAARTGPPALGRPHWAARTGQVAGGTLPAGPGYLPSSYQVSLGPLYQEEEAWSLADSVLSFSPPPSTSPEITPELLPRRPRLLILVNPFGGRGLAWQRCMDHVVPMISEAGLSFNLIQTGMVEGDTPGSSGGVWRDEEASWLTFIFVHLERQNHARELVQGLSLSEWEGIVTVSGDGLLYEVEPQTT